MRSIETVATVEIPEKVEALLEGRVITIKGEKGELTRDFSHAPINIQLDGKTVIVQANWPRKKEAALVGTVRSHIENMVKGVTKGFTYKMKIVEGRNFSKNMQTDYDQGAIINETAAKMFGWENPIGKKFKFAFDKNYFTVIGVVNDFHFRSLQNKIEPLVFIECWGLKNFVTARIQTNDVQKSITYLRQEWNKILPGFPFEYHFVKDMFRESYKAEDKLLKAILTFAGLAIILASLGLLGLTALTTVQRTKEIGIRKVLGASISNIIFTISKEFLFWVFVANILAQPIAYYFINKWLQNFPYRIDVVWWIFVLSGLTAIVIALLTVIVQAIKAATTNPIDSLRYE